MRRTRYTKPRARVRGAPHRRPPRPAPLNLYEVTGTIRKRSGVGSQQPDEDLRFQRQVKQRHFIPASGSRRWKSGRSVCCIMTAGEDWFEAPPDASMGRRRRQPARPPPANERRLPPTTGVDSRSRTVEEEINSLHLQRYTRASLVNTRAKWGASKRPDEAKEEGD